MRERVGPVMAHQVLIAKFSFALPIQPGEYSVTVGFANGGVGEADYAESLLFLHGVKTFQVYKNRQSILWSGVVNLFPRVAFIKEDSERFCMEAMPEEQAAKVEWRLAKCPAQTLAGKEFTVAVHLTNHSALALEFLSAASREPELPLEGRANPSDGRPGRCPQCLGGGGRAEVGPNV